MTSLANPANRLKPLAGLDPDLQLSLLAQVRDRLGAAPLDEDGALAAYARLHLGLVHIHPFWDGNGRMARLLANLPVLRAGHLPLVIEARERKRYIDTLAAYQLVVGPLRRDTGLWPRPELEGPFIALCRDAYAATRALIVAAHAQQAARGTRGRSGGDGPSPRTG
jgi:Fic family protein